MFTGIIEAIGTVRGRTPSGLCIERPATFRDLRIGSSVAVSGVCLTVVDRTREEISFDVVPETWRRTTLGGLRPGDRVNLERALSVQDRLEGHVVQGHVEASGTVANVGFQAPGRKGKLLTIVIPADLLPCVVPKGSIAIDGVSLTVASLDGDRCTLALIPHTLEETTVGSLRPGDRVNIETDVLLRGLRHLLPDARSRANRGKELVSRQRRGRVKQH